MIMRKERYKSTIAPVSLWSNLVCARIKTAQDFLIHLFRLELSMNHFC